MRKLLLSAFATGLALALFASPVMAQDGGDQPETPEAKPERKRGEGRRGDGRRGDGRRGEGRRGEGRRGEGRGRRGGEEMRKRREAMMKKYDKNKDGKLDDTERAALMDDRINKMFTELDKNSDGKIDAAEAKAAGRRGGFVMRADADKDGSVTKAEMKKIFGQRRRGQGRRGEGRRGEGRRGEGRRGEGRRGEGRGRRGEGRDGDGDAPKKKPAPKPTRKREPI